MFIGLAQEKPGADRTDRADHALAALLLQPTLRMGAGAAIATFACAPGASPWKRTKWARGSVGGAGKERDIAQTVSFCSYAPSANSPDLTGFFTWYRHGQLAALNQGNPALVRVRAH